MKHLTMVVVSYWLRKWSTSGEKDITIPHAIKVKNILTVLVSCRDLEKSYPLKARRSFLFLTLDKLSIKQRSTKPRACLRTCVKRNTQQSVNSGRLLIYTSHQGNKKRFHLVCRVSKHITQT